MYENYARFIAKNINHNQWLLKQAANNILISKISNWWNSLAASLQYFYFLPLIANILNYYLLKKWKQNLSLLKNDFRESTWWHEYTHLYDLEDKWYKTHYKIITNCHTCKKRHSSTKKKKAQWSSKEYNTTIQINLTEQQKIATSFSNWIHML